MSIAPYSLSRGNLLKFSSLRNIHSWICAAQCLCNKVRSEEGSRQGWLVETRVIYWFSNTKLNRCALCTSYAHQLSRLSRISLSVFVLAVSFSPAHAPESPLRLSLCSPVLRWLLSVSPRQLLQSDTGVPHFALDPLTYRCLLSLSPVADFAEPRPPLPQSSHTEVHNTFALN